MPAKKAGKKAVEVASVEVAQVVEKVAKVRKADVISSITELQLLVQETLAGLSGKLTERIAFFEELNTAIAAKEARLKELFGVEEQLLALDAIKGEVEAAQAAYDTELAERDEAREREAAEYTYQLNLVRRQAADKYNDQVAKDRKTQALEDEARKAELDDREAAVIEAEAELESYKLQVAQIPELVAKAEKATAAVVGSSLKATHEHEKALAAKDAEASAKIATQTIDSLKKEIASLQGQIYTLNTSLTEARAEVKEIAAKAVESASGQQALAALQQSQNAQAMNSKTSR